MHRDDIQQSAPRKAIQEMATLNKRFPLLPTWDGPDVTRAGFLELLRYVGSDLRVVTTFNSHVFMAIVEL